MGWLAPIGTGSPRPSFGIQPDDLEHQGPSFVGPWGVAGAGFRTRDLRVMTPPGAYGVQETVAIARNTCPKFGSFSVSNTCGSPTGVHV
jgi:hypothetical protein